MHLLEIQVVYVLKILSSIFDIGLLKGVLLLLKNPFQAKYTFQISGKIIWNIVINNLP